MNRRGQVTVEFILIMVLALIYLTTIIQPNAELSASAMQDVANMGKLRVSAQKLADAISYVSISGEGTKQTLQLVVPPDGVINCGIPFTPTSPIPKDENSVYYSYKLKSGKGLVACDDDLDHYNPEFPNLMEESSHICTSFIDAGTDIKSSRCSPVNIYGYVNGSYYTAVVEKKPTGVQVVFK